MKKLLVDEASVKQPEQNGDSHVQAGIRSDVTDHMTKENEKRGNWMFTAQGTLALVGLGIGAHNFWSTPTGLLEYGPAYLIAYTILMLCVGLPLVYHSLAMGQYTSQGLFTCWPLPVFKGVGVFMLSYGVPMGLLFNIYNSWTLYYLHLAVDASVGGTTLSWASRQQVNSLAPECWNLHQWKNPDYVVVSSCSVFGNDRIIADSGICWEVGIENGNTTRNVRGIYDLKMAFNGVEHQRLGANPLFHFRKPLDVFFNCHVTGSALTEYDAPGVFNGALALCLLAVWLLVLLSTGFGVKSIGVVSMVTVPFASILLLMLCIRALTLEGAHSGVAHALSFINYGSIVKLSHWDMWVRAAEDVTNSMVLGFGLIITYASYNRFHNNFVRDAVLLCSVNYIINILIGLTVFGFLGNMSHVKGTDLSNLNATGIELVYTVMPILLESVTGDGVWCGIFYTMILFFSFNQVIALVETIVTAILDQWSRGRKYRFLWSAGVCVICFLISLPACKASGHTWASLIPYASKISSSIACLLTAVCFAVYGAMTYFRFRHEVAAMTRWDLCCWPSVVCFVAMTSLLVTAGVVALFVVILASTYELSTGRTAELTVQNQHILMIIYPIVILVVFVVCQMLLAKFVWKQPIRELFSPSWGPALDRHAETVKTYHSQNPYSSQSYTDTDSPTKPAFNGRSNV